MIKVLVVEDSPVISESLVHMLRSDPEIQVVGTAKDGAEAIKVSRSLKPDIITMDIHMPIMDGLEATRRIMEIQPVPIVIVTASPSAREIAGTFRAIEAGALAMVSRPVGIGHPEHETTKRQLIETVKLMSEVKVVKRWLHRPSEVPGPSALPHEKIEIETMPSEVKCVAIGASTGGPVALQTILSRLPKEFPAPVLIVQHMAGGFIHGFAQWLAASSRLPVHVASDGEYLLPGHVYVAPDSLHMGVGSGRRIMLSQEGPENGLRPSVSFLFRSVVRAFGRRVVGVLLTGMGRDGAEELKMMKDAHAVTFAQNKDSSVVFGMPGEAIKLDAATYVLSPEEIGAAMSSLVNKIGGQR